MQAYLTRRKGNKILVIYDLNITLNWTGKLATEDKEVRTMACGLLELRLCKRYAKPKLSDRG